jgi:hypothetical protein
MVNWRGLLALALAVQVISLISSDRRWWWLVFAAPLTLNPLYWWLKGIYFPAPPPSGAGSLYFEPEAFLAVSSIPTIVVAMVIGYHFNIFASEVSKIRRI